MNMQLMPWEFVVCKVEDCTGINFEEAYTFFARTEEELSLVCRAESLPQNTTHREGGWRALKICGILEFDMVGVLAGITGLLAGQGIGLFAISTFHTDYILVKQHQVEQAVATLSANGYQIS